MARNAIETDFRSSKMASGNHFVNKFQTNKSCVFIWNGEKCDRKWFSVIENCHQEPFCEQNQKSKMAAGSHFVKKTRGLSAWQLRCLIIHWVWYTAQRTPNDQGQMSRGKLKDHTWFTICLWKSYMMLHLGDTTFWRHVTLIRPWKLIQGEMSWGKLIVHTMNFYELHRWLLICVSNKLWSERA